MRKLTKPRPLFFARRLAADPPRARSAAPRRRGTRRGRGREHNASSAADRVLPGRERPDGNWEGRREGRRTEREKKEDLWHCGGGGRRGKRSSIILASTDGGTEGRTEGRREALAAPRVAQMDATVDGQTGTVATELCRASVGLCVVASRPHLRIPRREMRTGRGQRKRSFRTKNRYLKMFCAKWV